MSQTHGPNAQDIPTGLPLINSPAPDFEVVTTQGVRKLEDYRGQWLILFSHPADFTPVCTTEFLSFSRSYQTFRDLNCDLLGLSVDSNQSHLGWIRNIEEKFGVKVPFPIIADLRMAVARAYGMIHPQASDTSAVRSVFVIDPEGVLKAVVYYPMTNGRSVAELIRLLQSLQMTYQHGLATPEGWHPGDKVVVPPPATVADAEARLQENYDVTDWYFAQTDAPEAVPSGTEP